LFEPFRFADLRHPYPAYRELRDRAPVHYAPEADVYCVSRYDDVQAVLQDHSRFSSRAMFTVLMANGKDGPPPITRRTLAFMLRMVIRARMNPLTFANARTLIAEDGESHSQLRSIVNRGFTPRRIAGWEERARHIATGCVGRLRARASFDVVHDVAVPVPLTIIAEMLGVEPERHDDFKRWSTDFVANITGPGRADPFSRPWQESLIELINYVRGFARRRREQPRDDLISSIVSEQDGGLGVSDREVVQFAILLLVAGNETTTNLIATRSPRCSITRTCSRASSPIPR
jgi:cytochrome P450